MYGALRGSRNFRQIGRLGAIGKNAFPASEPRMHPAQFQRANRRQEKMREEERRDRNWNAVDLGDNGGRF